MIKSQNGFTLLELLIGATLSAAVLAAVLSSYIFMGRQLARLANQQTLETEGRRTLAAFAQDVQQATGISGTPTAAAVTLVVPGNAGSVSTIAYTFTNNTSGNGTLVRTPSGGTAQTLLRNITNTGLFFRYYDAAGSAYDNGSSPYTTYTTYLPGIKQLALEFNTQIVTVNNGTSTAVYKAASHRLILRNRALLP
jgi:prepilin-type N-terminal cleavage/methylation domain-containing protein